jgi:DUF4097 and DUF4098 domain-containing protein YvlB
VRGRPGSITGPIVLVLIGLVFLLNNLGHDVPVWAVISNYWPVMLIVLGVIGLVEVMYHVGRGAPVPPRPLTTGGFFWIVVVVAFVSWVGHHHNIRIGPLTNGGVSLLGSEYEFDVNATGASQGVSRVILDNLHGNLSLKGESDGDVKVTGRKTIRAFSKGDADRADQQSGVKVERQGDLLIIRAEEPGGSRMLSVSTDLDITLPRGLDVEARGRSGDLTVDDIAGSVDISSGRGDVRLANIGKDVKIDATRNGLIRASDVKGNVELQGHGSDVQIDNVQGQVTVNGEFAGTLEFRAISKMLRFQSSRSDLRAEAVPGNVTVELGEVRMNNIVGPVRFKTGSRDIHATDVTNSLELDLDRGDVEITQTKTPLPKLDIRDRNGDLTLAMPGNASFDLDGKVRQGEINNEFGELLSTSQEGHGGEIKGKAGNGPEIRLSTDRGNLTVKKN